jgi:hypothetical protein
MIWYSEKRAGRRQYGCPVQMCNPVQQLQRMFPEAPGQLGGASGVSIRWLVCVSKIVPVPSYLPVLPHTNNVPVPHRLPIPLK